MVRSYRSESLTVVSVAVVGEAASTEQDLASCACRSAKAIDVASIVVVLAIAVLCKVDNCATDGLASLRNVAGIDVLGLDGAERYKGEEGDRVGEVHDCDGWVRKNPTVFVACSLAESGT